MNVELKHQEQAAFALLAATSDVAMLLSPDGTISDAMIGSSEIPETLARSLVGRNLLDTVTVESRVKIDELLRAARNGETARWRQVNHRDMDGPEVAISYSAMCVGQNGHVIVTGRSFEALASIQRKLILAEQAIEREYQNLRGARNRLRVLLQATREPFIFVDSRSGRITDCNAAASALSGKRVIGSDIASLFANDETNAVTAALETLRNSGRTEDIHLRQSFGGQRAVLSFNIFREDGANQFLLRLVLEDKSESRTSTYFDNVFGVIDQLPDGFVLTDESFNILVANPAFLDLSQVSTLEQVRGQPLGRWLGRPRTDMAAMATDLLNNKSFRNWRTILIDEFGSHEDVIVSAVSVSNGNSGTHGFAIRLLDRAAVQSDKEVPENRLLRSAEDFTRLVGTMPLKELVRESTDIIERRCIEAALELTGNNRASASELLGLSRQSLYSKLARYGISQDAASKTEESS